ncbi:recombinase family protein [Alkalihalophilus marmarensis]|uniref:recombinase family protein n=1 Tax=Alkalihalophilus marmarensis TaxID=521377 RepID=UPI002E24EF05|nr:recombinase family protein [Alkalihalophilus marmarensis]MED1601769.1 recombinase family protein [Alkalihalophilus marmarensis]
MDELQKGMWVRTLWDPVKAREESPLIGDKPVKVAAYCRISTDTEKQMNSLENQVHHYTHMIRNKPNWKFVGVYFDNGISGTNAKKQPGLQRLLRHAEEGRIDFILTKNVSRLTRNAEHLISIVEQLKAKGVGIYFEEQKLDTSIEYNQFLLSTYAALAQEEVQAVSNSVKWGYEKRLQNGKPPFNHIYGYRKATKNGQATLEIHQEEAKVVQQIFDWYLQGWTLTGIAKELTKRGIKTAKGKDVWQSQTVKGMLKRPTYTGNKVSRIHSKELFTNKYSQGTQDQVMIKNTHPPIISLEVFEQAQERLNQNIQKAKKPKKKEPPSFRNRICCYRCNYRLTYTRRVTASYWQCHASRVGECENPMLTDDGLYEMILKALNMRFDMDDSSILLTSKRILQKTNQQDHFEFHRLKWLSEMEIARETLSDKEILQLEKDYREFEKEIGKIEEDRPFRMKTLQWLESVKSLDNFYGKVTLDDLRGWVLDITVASEKDYEVVWLDKTTTTIGNPTQFEHTKINKTKENVTGEEVKQELTLLNENGDFKDKDEGEMAGKTITREVEVIEPNKGHSILESIEKSKMDYQKPGMLETKRLRTAAYCRVSSDHLEQTGSIKNQIAYYTYFILKDPKFEFAGIFADEGISGLSMKDRTEFHKLLRECEKSRIDLIVTKSISRFSRNVLDTLNITRKLKTLPNPVYVYFEKENLWTNDPQSDLILSIFGGIAQEESINLGSSISWGLRTQAKRGVIHRKQTNYGYKADKHFRWHIVEEEAKVIRRIYKDVRKGKTVYQISQDLSKEDIKSPTGKDNWNKSTVDRILKSEKYRGDYLFQQYVTVNTADKRPIINQGEAPQYYIEEHHEAIIDPKEWEEVQAILDERARVAMEKSAPHKDVGEHKIEVLTNKMYCGECGQALVHSRTQMKSSKNYYHNHYWTCRHFDRPHQYVNDPCDTRYIRQRYIKQHFIHLLEEISISTTFYQDALDAISQVELSDVDLDEEKRVQNELYELNQVLYDAVSEGLKEQGQDSRKVDRITEELCGMYDQLKVYSNRRENAIQYRKNLKQFMKNLKLHTIEQPTTFSEELYKEFIEKATVYKSGKVIYHFNFGFEWTTDERYDSFLELMAEERKEKSRQRHEALRNRPEIAELLKYCEEPRVMKEILAFINERMFISKPHLMDVVIKPLLELGRMETYKAKRDDYHLEQNHYRMKKDEEI